MGKHCSTCSCVEQTGGGMRDTEFCDSEASRGHEEWGCLEQKGHALPHKSMIVRNDPCSDCGGLEEHTAECSRIGVMEDDSKPMMETQWDDDGVVQFVPYPPRPERETGA